MTRWEATGELVDGVVLLEASAGTGKTYAITDLALRIVAEGRAPLDELLIVTFTRAAAAELRERIRGRLQEGRRALVAQDGGRDPVLALLCAGGDAQIAARLGRVERALAGIDDATITTIHGFAQRALRRIAVEAGTDVEVEVVTGTDDLRIEVADDVWNRLLDEADDAWCGYLLDVGKVTRKDAAMVVRAVDSAPEARILPDEPFDPDDPFAAWREAVEDFADACATADVADLSESFDELFDRGALKRAKKPGTYAAAKLQADAAAACSWATARQDSGPSMVKDWPVEARRFAPTGGSSLGSLLVDPADLPNHPICAAAVRLVAATTAPAERFRAHLGRLARDELARRRAAQPGLDFDGLLLTLGAALDGPRGDVLAARLRERWTIALVDEFQDTDPVQWRILERLFADRTLALIGDPKQAIYGFRGADLPTYLQAAQRAEDGATLPRSWRSDRSLVDAVTTVFGAPGAFVDPRITAPPLEAEHDDRRLVRGGGGGTVPLAALVTRFVSRDVAVADGGMAFSGGGMTKAWVDRAVARDVATVTVELLSEGATLEDRAARRPLAPRDIAVLVRSGIEAARIRESLADAGVPVATQAAGSVLATSEATEVQAVLDAMLAPGSDRAVRAAAATRLVGWDGLDLAEADDDRWDELADQMDRWRRSWEHRGVAAALREAIADRGTITRLLGERGGERRVTDLTHLIEILAEAAVDRRMGPEATATWLRDARAQADDDDETTQLRLDRDDDAVTVSTIHRSKGLEYPVVLCPSLWRLGDLHPSTDRILTGHDPEDADGVRRRWVDVSIRPTPGTPGAARREVAAAEQLGEDTRLAYVALTRARHLAVLWWGRGNTAETSPLAGLFHGREEIGSDGELHARGRARVESAEDTTLVADLRALATQMGSSFAVSPWTGVPRTPHLELPATTAPAALRVLPSPSVIPRWERASFSGLKGRIDAIDSAVAAGDPDRDRIDHDTQPEDPAVATRATPVPQLVQVPYGALPGGTAAGSLVHEVLEVIDFAGGGDPDAIRAAVAERAGRHGFDERVADDVVSGVQATLGTPLGPLVGDACLADVRRERRLDELAFELPLGSGDAGTTTARFDRVLRVLADFEGTPAVPTGSVERLGGGRPIDLRGYLTGFIDLIAEVPDGRLLIVDYKTNVLRAPDGVVDPGRYDPRTLADEVANAAYVLQYLLYAVALRRFLRWRRGAVDWDAEVAGAAYLFVRGMTGPEVRRDGERPFGIHAAALPAELIGRLDDVLRGGDA